MSLDYGLGTMTTTTFNRNHTIGPYSANAFLSLICIVEKSLSLCRVSFGTVYFCVLKLVVVGVSAK